jgi:hypothetical protein
VGLALIAAPTDPAKTHGGIEIGGRGVKATVLEVQPGGIYRRLFSKTRNITLSTLDDRGAFRPLAIDETVKSVAEFYRIFRETYKLPPERIHIVGSSGVPKAVNRADFVKAVNKATAKDLRFIDDRTEVALTITGVVPRDERDISIILDIGGGNTKGGYQPTGKPLVYVAVPLGSVTFTDKVRQRAKEKKTSLVVAAADLRESELVKPLREGARTMPDLAGRKKVYLSGGMVWAMVSIIKPGAVDDALVTFTVADISAFHKLVARSPGRFPGVDLAGIRDEGRRSRAKAALGAVGKAYQADNLVAGAEILRALGETFRLEEKTLIFPRNAVFGWLAAYVAGEADKP